MLGVFVTIVLIIPIKIYMYICQEEIGDTYDNSMNHKRVRKTEAGLSCIYKLNQQTH